VACASGRKIVVGPAGQMCGVVVRVRLPCRHIVQVRPLPRPTISRSEFPVETTAGSVLVWPRPTPGYVGDKICCSSSAPRRFKTGK
jgi:hypothetical protein